MSFAELGIFDKAKIYIHLPEVKESGNWSYAKYSKVATLLNGPKTFLLRTDPVAVH